MAAQRVEPPHLATDLKTLCLSTVAAQWRPLAEQATRQRQAPADYLAQLVHLEVTGRRERRIQRRIQDARFPMLKTLDAFSFEAQPGLDRDVVLQIFDCGFVADAANIVLVGGVGTGKSHLSIALGMACCQHDYRVRFVTAAELVTLLVEAQQQGRLARKLAQLARFDVVIVDELIMTGPSAITTNSGHSAQSRNTSPGRRGESPADANPETGAEAPTDGRPGAGDPGPPTPGSDSRGRAARRAKRRQSVLRQRSEHTGRELPQIRLEVRRVRAVHHRTARTDSPAPRLPRPERAADPSMPTAAPRKPRPTRRQQVVRRRPRQQNLWVSFGSGRSPSA